MKRPGLRTRVTAGFSVAAMVVAVAMALLSYQLTEQFLLEEREDAAKRATYYDARIVRAGLAADNPDFTNVLKPLDTGGKRLAMLRFGGDFYGRTSIDDGVTDSFPPSLIRMVEGGQPAVQRLHIDSRPALVIGIPMGAGVSFYMVDYLDELDTSLTVLGLVLTLVAVLMTATGAGLGWYAARYVVRPLTSMVNAANEIAAGDFTTRLDPSAEPDLARLTSSFNEMVDQLSQRLERDRRFAADVSHELRSPLQTLAAAASVLTRRKADLDPRTAAAAGLVAEEVVRFQTLVTDLLELARSDQPPDLTPVNVADLARQVCRARGVPTGIVDVDHGTNPIWQIDRRRFQQILANLLDNAERHGGGPLTVRIGQRDGIRFLDVDDEGPGVSPPNRGTIFDRFVRGRSSNARGDSDGTGLGLALVAQHVSAHGGRVHVMDRPGGGARFRIELPEQRR